MISNWRVKTTSAQQYYQPRIFYCCLYRPLQRTKGAKTVPLFLHPREHSEFFEQKYFKSFSCNIISNAIILENDTILLPLKSIGISITVKITFYTFNIIYNLFFYYRDLCALHIAFLNCEVVW